MLRFLSAHRAAEMHAGGGDDLSRCAVAPLLCCDPDLRCGFPRCAATTRRAVLPSQHGSRVAGDRPATCCGAACCAEASRALQSRAVHVFTEAARVLRFRNICLGPESNELKLVTLGGLLRKSHESLRDKYDCSCPELEELMVCSRRAGAFGARLTGAGWGGCSIHLVRQHQARPLTYSISE